MVGRVAPGGHAKVGDQRSLEPGQSFRCVPDRGRQAEKMPPHAVALVAALSRWIAHQSRVWGVGQKQRPDRIVDGDGCLLRGSVICCVVSLEPGDLAGGAVNNAGIEPRLADGGRGGRRGERPRS